LVSPYRGPAPARRRGAILAGLSVLGAAAVVYVGTKHIEPAVVLGSAVTLESAASAPPAKPALAKLKQAHLVQVEEAELLRQDATGLQDAARLKNAAWLSHQYDSREELKGLAPAAVILCDVMDTTADVLIYFFTETHSYVHKYIFAHTNIHIYVLLD